MVSSLMIAVVVPFFASVLTFFSGFGLSTLLVPTCALLFPLDVAIAVAAVVHLLNNLLKFFLMRSTVDFSVALKFGIPAMGGALLGALALSVLAHGDVLWTYAVGTSTREVRSINVVIGLIMISFAVLELIPQFAQWRISRRYMVFGGLASGFFGGLSGHQGAFRSAFLLNLGFDKEHFIATGVVIACGVDIVRLVIYGVGMPFLFTGEEWVFLSITMASALIGSLVGWIWLPKFSFQWIRRLVGVALLILGVLIAFGMLS